MAEQTVAFVAPQELEQQAKDWATCFGEASCGVERIFMPDAETVRVRLRNGKTWEIKCVPLCEYWDDGGSLEIETL